MAQPTVTYTADPTTGSLDFTSWAAKGLGLGTAGNAPKADMSGKFEPLSQEEWQKRKAYWDRQGASKGLENWQPGDPLSGTPDSPFSGVTDGIMGKNSFDPRAYRINEAASERDRLLALNGRTMQGNLGAQLNATMLGQGPTVAGLQMQQGTARALSDIGSQAASARGMSRGAAMRTATLGGMANAQQANRDAALVRAQEQLAARGQYAQVAEQQRAQDLATREQDIGIEKGNQQAYGQALGYQTTISEGNAGRKQKGTGAILSAGGAALKAIPIVSDIRAKDDVHPIKTDQQFFEKLKSVSLAPSPQNFRRQDSAQARADSANAGYGAYNAEQQRQAAAARGDSFDPRGSTYTGVVGTSMQAMGSGLMSDGPIYDDSAASANAFPSDRKSKERIRQLEMELDGREPRQLDQQNPYADAPGSEPQENREGLGPLKPYSFRYKPEMALRMSHIAAPGSRERSIAIADAYRPRAGIMAQDLEKSPAGRAVVEHTPIGLQLDAKRAIGFALAHEAGLDKRVRKLEARK